MPNWYSSSWQWKQAKIKKAQAKVKAKFPNLLEGSTGWNRAFNAYLGKM